MDPSFVSRFNLTSIEMDIFAQIVRGRSNAAIAGARQRSVETVRKQVATMFRKLGVSTRRELRALLGGQIAHAAASPTPSLAPETLLSGRELEVLRRVAQGQSNKRIAGELGVTESTIGVLLHRARAKFKRRDAMLREKDVRASSAQA